MLNGYSTIQLGTHTVNIGGEIKEAEVREYRSDEYVPGYPEEWYGLVLDEGWIEFSTALRHASYEKLVKLLRECEVDETGYCVKYEGGDGNTLELIVHRPH